MRVLAALVGLALLAQPAAAQFDSREAIALQNQILQLRQELEQLRARGGGSSIPAPVPRGGGGGNEMVGQLLDRVTSMEEETRRLRGRVDELDNRNRRLQADLTKLGEDMEFRLTQRESGVAPPARPGPTGAVVPPTRPVAPVVAPVAAPTGAPRTPERALSEGQAALGRRDFPVAEAAAREALAGRAGAQQANAQLLLGDALAGRRDFGNAAIAYNEAYTRARTSPRAPEALIGLAAAFQGLGSKREACDTLGDLRSNHPNIAAPLQQRADAVRVRAGCR